MRDTRVVLDIMPLAVATDSEAYVNKGEERKHQRLDRAEEDLEPTRSPAMPAIELRSTCFHPS